RLFHQPDRSTSHRSPHQTIGDRYLQDRRTLDDPHNHAYLYSADNPIGDRKRYPNLGNAGWIGAYHCASRAVPVHLSYRGRPDPGFTRGCQRGVRSGAGYQKRTSAGKQWSLADYSLGYERTSHPQTLGLGRQNPAFPKLSICHRGQLVAPPPTIRSCRQTEISEKYVRETIRP